MYMVGGKGGGFPDIWGYPASTRASSSIENQGPYYPTMHWIVVSKKDKVLQMLLSGDEGGSL